LWSDGRNEKNKVSQVAIIVFRETLEVAIITSLLLAATRGVKGRLLWLAIGIAVGALGSGVVGVFAEKITDSFSGRGQDLFNAIVLSLTVLLVAWTIAWMRKHGAMLAAEARVIGERVRSGQGPLYLLATAVGVAVLRDGSELVVFITALQLSGRLDVISIAMGFAGGLIAGVAVGGMIYFGVIRAALKSLFTVVTVLLAFLGAGMAAQAASFFVSSGWLPPLIDPLWDSSALIDDSSFVGNVAHALFGYVSQPSAAQMLAYVAVLAVIFRLGLKPLAPVRAKV
jgi:high-affinity iron transporter